MSKNFSVICLILIAAFFQGCAAADSQIAKTEIAAPSPIETPSPPKNETREFTGGKAEFQGVSLDYNQQTFGNITAQEESEVRLENKDDKPDSVMPKNILFNVKLPNSERKGTIQIIPIADYRRMYAVSEELTKLFDTQLQVVKKEIGSKILRDKREIPIVPFWDSSNIFTAKVKRFPFQKGQGIFWLTQWSQDYAGIVNNEALTLMYQGISDDGKYYILAELPTTVSFLPKYRDVQEFEGYKLPQNSDEFKKSQKPYEDYLAKITKRLENLPQDQYKPNLSEFEKIISSLKIQK